MKSIDSLIFVDIETVGGREKYEQMPAHTQLLWDKKMNYITTRDDITAQQLYEQKSGIYSEFGKVIVISCGYFAQQDGELQYHHKSFAGHDEQEILTQFATACEQWSSRYSFCGHNIREFDIPYLCRRMLVNGIRLPALINMTGKKPREVPHIDTMELRKFGDNKSFTSLDLMCQIMGIESPKQDISGADVHGVYYQTQDLDRITRYCQEDVRAVAQLYQKLIELM